MEQTNTIEPLAIWLVLWIGFAYLLSFTFSSRIISIGGGFILGTVGLAVTFLGITAIVEGNKSAIAKRAGFSTYEEYERRKAQGFSTKGKYERHLTLEEQKQTERREMERRAEESAKNQEWCKRNLQCWVDKKSNSAADLCRKPVESMARYGFHWTDGWLEQKFSHYRWSNKSKLWLTYIGDKIEFQNRFGGWQRYRYECDLDTVNDVVLDVRAQPGKLR